jgi:two-component system, LytTR family, response regulator LytT
LNFLDDELAKSEVGCITVRSDRKNVNVPFDQIVYIESFNDYVKIHIKGNNALVTKEKISSLHAKLPSFFVRIHRSFIVNRHQVLSHNKESVFIGEMELSLGRKYKVDAVKSLGVNG